MRTALDPEILKELKALQCEGGPDVLAELAKLFVETMDGSASKVREAVAARNFPDLESAAHILKSGSANVGALTLSEISKKLETAGASKDAAVLENLLAEFNAEFTAVITELKLL